MVSISEKRGKTLKRWLCGGLAVLLSLGALSALALPAYAAEATTTAYFMLNVQGADVCTSDDMRAGAVSVTGTKIELFDEAGKTSYGVVEVDDGMVSEQGYVTGIEFKVPSWKVGDKYKVKVTDTPSYFVSAGTYSDMGLVNTLIGVEPVKFEKDDYGEAEDYGWK